MKVVRLSALRTGHLNPLRKYSWYSFLLEAESTPGLYSFLLAPPDVSTRDPSSERRKYLGEKWPVILTESCDFHAYSFGFFYMPQICDMGQTAVLPFRRKACYCFFRPEKSDGLGRVRTRELGYERPARYL